MSNCPKTLYDNQKNNLVIYNNQRNSNALNYLYQGPRTGATGTFTLRGFKGRYKQQGVDQLAQQESTTSGVLPTLPTTGFLAQSSQCTRSQASNRCLQLRRSLRNYNASIQEANQRKRKSMTRNRRQIRYNNNYPNLLFYHIKTMGNGAKVFKKMCKVDGAYKCRGKVVVPRGKSLNQVLCERSPHKYVRYYEIDSYPTSSTVTYNEYLYKNGLWNFERQITRDINESPPYPTVQLNRYNLIPRSIQS